jgi:hypothetical protein
MKNLLIAMSLASVSLLAAAKLPALTGEAKTKADETAAKAVWSGKVDAYLLCKSQDKVAASYFKTARAAGKETRSPTAAQPCADPGPFAYTPGEQKPIESSGAHSPAGNATSPPSTRQPDAVGNPGSKS